MQRAPFFGITVLFSCLVFGCEARPSNAIANTDTSAGENDWATSRSATPRGEIKALKIRDDVYNRDRNIWVYTPPGYDAAASTPYHLAVFLDGMSYATEEIPAGIIFDNLLAARRIQPTVALMVDTSESRMDDLANHQRFADSI